MIFQESEWNPIPKATLFGVYWDGSVNTSMLRTDDSELFEDPTAAVNNGDGSSPFDDYMPWSGMRIVEDAEAGTLVSIPKYWYKWTKDGDAMTLQISNKEVDGFFVSPAHADRDDGKGERDIVYVGRYHCSDTNYKSLTGVVPKDSVTRANARSNIHALGSNIWLWDFAMYWTIAMLYIVEYADWDSQTTIGYGCGVQESGEHAETGKTDAMTYHTGTNVARGGAGFIQYRHIEGLWDTAVNWCDGIYCNSTNVYAINNPANYSDTTGGTLIGTRGTSSGWIKSWNIPSASGFGWALYPSTLGGSASTYICDRFSSRSTGVNLCVGGHDSTATNNYGMFFISFYQTATGTSATYGSRLQKLP